MFRITDAVKHLLLINVLMYFGTLWIMGDPSGHNMGALIQEYIVNEDMWGRLQLALFYPSSPYFRPYQLITHMFMHANLEHLFFNMFALFMFGPHLERLWGPKRFTFFYLFSGIGALALHLFVIFIQINYLSGTALAFLQLQNTPTLGASGAIFGILVGFAMKFPNVELFLLFLPIPIKAKYFVLIYAGFELFMGFSPYGNNGVAHFAHLGGALFGLLLILYWNKYGSRIE